MEIRTNAQQSGLVKRVFIVAVLAAIALGCHYGGYLKGIRAGAQITHSWWVDQKSITYDAGEVIRQQVIKKHNRI